MKFGSNHYQQDPMIKRRARLLRVAIQENIFLVMVVIFGLFFLMSYKTFYITTKETFNAYSFFVKIAEKALESVIWKKDSFSPIFVFYGNNGNKRVTKQRLFALVQNAKASNNSPLEWLKEAVLQCPMIKNVLVQRNIATNTVSITIEEHNPIGFISTTNENSNEVIFLLNQDGSRMEINTRQFKEFLIEKDTIECINVTSFEEYLNLYSFLIYKNLAGSVKSTTMISNRRWDLRFRNGLLVKLPSTNWDEAIEKLVVLNQRMGLLEESNKIVYVDLRANDKIFLR